ncbi:YHS domain-containing (seleno)protein [Bradyrhizobium sp. ARR65]|uniref:YHS domain-containing (seleno)protein n=1 Tax=Bradyrhizobium sp. ARR65 TaxID=1040989 RepID=UPI00054EFD79|nr:YHS domain-containing (seleno)protein [Bradyrhizobium sp. ARR65]
MTAQRQERYVWRPGIAVITLLAVFCAAYNDVASGAATTERIITNRFSGLAIEGFDPVAYFVDGRSVLGLPEFEAWEEGVVWRFHNEGNRASFLAHPEIYGPQFGGYDPVDIARGVAVAGNPRFWLIAGERLYLFGFEANRAAFAADPKGFIGKAQARWPSLKRQLAQ